MEIIANFAAIITYSYTVKYEKSIIVSIGLLSDQSDRNGRVHSCNCNGSWNVSEGRYPCFNYDAMHDCLMCHSNPCLLEGIEGNAHP